MAALALLVKRCRATPYPECSSPRFEAPFQLTCIIRAFSSTWLRRGILRFSCYEILPQVSRPLGVIISRPLYHARSLERTRTSCGFLIYGRHWSAKPPPLCPHCSLTQTRGLVGIMSILVSSRSYCQMPFIDQIYGEHLTESMIMKLISCSRFSLLSTFISAPSVEVERRICVCRVLMFCVHARAFD